MLRVSKQATQSEIKAAFRRLARQYHPDLNPDNPTAASEFQRISEAYRALLGTPELNDEPSVSQETSPAHRKHYIHGVQCNAQGNYQQAVDAFTQAITLNSQYLEAYLGRCQARYVLGDDRGAIEDAYQVLTLNPNVSQAHYYQGRARARLGYTESSLAAYTRAIQIDSSYASAYYYRGIAHESLQDRPAAKQDWRTASRLFQAQGDVSGVQKAQSKLRGWPLPAFPTVNIKALQFTRWTVARACKLLPNVLFNPGGELLPSFARCSSVQAAAIGFIWAALATLTILASLLLYESPPSSIDVVLLSGTAFLSLVAASAIARLLNRSRGNWAGDVFVAGAALLPLSLFAVLGGLAQSSLGFTATAGVLSGSYVLLTLYVGCTQIHNFWERSAAFAAPLMAITSGGITVWVATEFLGWA
ncbi:DnaJ domain-containing protein [Acaryochloris thomasi]|uniref:DnaJ domain-containing protein n=1 Tax=Acaryochloris thomasi TaxID=2929456 RepID=UPI001F1951DC|nr:DnaJ domain-containing protein [Acaryochloris thomasi]